MDQPDELDGVFLLFLQGLDLALQYYVFIVPLIDGVLQPVILFAQLGVALENLLLRTVELSYQSDGLLLLLLVLAAPLHQLRELISINHN